MTRLADIQSLGLSAPIIGPWFYAHQAKEQPELPLPDAGSLALKLPQLEKADVNDKPVLRWLPPTIGTLTYSFAGPKTAKALKTLRKADGTPAFLDEGAGFIAHFEIERGAYRRLQQLFDLLLKDDAADNTIGRPLAASLTMAISGITEADVLDLVPGLPSEEPLAAIGLDDKVKPVRDFKIPAGKLPVEDFEISERINSFDINFNFQQPATSQLLLNLTNAHIGNASISAHDSDGLPVDPGAFAAQLQALVEAQPGIAAKALTEGLPIPSADNEPQPVCRVASGRSVHVIGLLPHTLDGTLRKRVKISWRDNQDNEQTVDTGAVVLPDGDDDVAVKLASGADPLIAGLMPSGQLSFGEQEDPPTDDKKLLTLWEQDAPFERDQLRLVVAAPEQLFTGAKRQSETEKKDKQDFASSRVLIGRAEIKLGVTGADAAKAFSDTAAAGQILAASEAADASFGTAEAITPTELDPDTDFEALRENLSVSAEHLRGTGKQANGVVTGAYALVTARFSATGPTLADGVMVTALMHHLDNASGRLVRVIAGTGVARLDANSNQAEALVLLGPLPEISDQANDAMLGFDLVLEGSGQTRILQDLRVPRPAFQSADPMTNAAPTDPILAVESGTRQPAGPPSHTPARTHIALSADGPTLWQPSSQTAYASDTLAQKLTAGDQVTLFPIKDTTADLAQVSAATVTVRSLADFLPAAGTGLIGRYRGTAVAVNSNDIATESFISGAPLSARLCGSSSLQAPNDAVMGRPACVLSAQIKGAGPLFAEQVRGAVEPNSIALATSAPDFVSAMQTASDALEISDTSASCCALRSTGIAGEGNQIEGAVVAVDSIAKVRDFERWLTEEQDKLDKPSLTPEEQVRKAALDRLETEIDAQDHRLRAAHRRVLAASGLNETRNALLSAIARAEHDIFICAEAADDDAAGGKMIRDALLKRLSENPSLRIIVAIAAPPKALGDMAFDPQEKTYRASKWAAPLIAEARERVGCFVPAGPLRTVGRQFGSSLCVDSLACVLWPGGLTRWGLARNSSIGAAFMGEQLSGNKAELVKKFQSALLSWAINDDQLPSSLKDILKLLHQARRIGDTGRILSD